MAEAVIFCLLNGKLFQTWINPILQQKSINNFKIIRRKDVWSFDNDKIKYLHYHKGIFGLFNAFTKLISAASKKEVRHIIGIYFYPYGILSILVSKITNKKSIISLIGTDWDEFTNKPANPINNSLTKYLSIQLLKLADFVTVTGQKSKNLITNLGISKNKVYALPNPIDPKFFDSEAKGQKDYDILFVGTLTREKRVQTVLFISKLVKNFIPNLKVCIVGIGPLESQLRELSAKLELEDNIEFAGYTENIMHKMIKSKILLSVSEQEGLPTVAIEAMACGLSVVCSNVGDVEDLIEDSLDGFLLDDYNDLVGFSAKIISILSNDEIRKIISRRASKKAFSFVSESRTVWSEIFKES